MVYTKKESSVIPHWSRPRTFFLAPDQWKDPYVLDMGESHHLSRVLRIQKGEEVYVLDGRGREGIFLVKEIYKDKVILSHIDDWIHSEPLSKVILAAGWTKSVRRGWIFEKAVELEAWALWFWQADFSQFPIPQESKKSWQGQIIAGAKQCRNPWFPILQTYNGVHELVQATDELNCNFRHVLVEDTCGPAELLTYDLLKQSGITVCVIGPEGGFSSREIQELKQKNFVSLSLGDRVLRWETAAILCLGLHWWKHQCK